MLIYLADLSHTGVGRSPNVVPLGMGYLAAFAKKYYPELSLRIFRDPAHLLDALKMEKPDLVGFSVHLWSENLSAFCAKKIKELCNSTIVMAGGPSIDDLDSEIIRFMENNPQYDICIPGEGEMAFVHLIEHLKANGGLKKDQAIDGCAIIAPGGRLLRGKYILPNLDEIPSPYLGGFLDAFLGDGYEPIIQSMRGCPYSCKFCVSGTPQWSKLRAFDLKRVFEEFDYVQKRAKVTHLILTDENFGILQQRDVELAKYIIRSYRDGSFPRRLYFYTAKIVTDHVLQIIEILSPIGEFGISFQTLSPCVRNEIRRTNISYERFLECLRWASKRKMLTSTEMIFGFPGETAESYLAGLEQLITSGVDRVYSYNLRLFSGIDLASLENREKHQLKTAFRLPERTYGFYDGHFVAEAEEVVVGSTSFDISDYYKVRKYGFFLELCCGRGYLVEFIKIMKRLGVPGEKVVKFFTEHEFSSYPHLAFIVKEYMEKCKKELFGSVDDCIECMRAYFLSGKPIPEVKLNFIYIGKIVFDKTARNEFIAALKEFVSRNTSQGAIVSFFDDYLSAIFLNQIVTFQKDEAVLLLAESRVALEKIEAGTYSNVEELLCEGTRDIAFELHEDSMNFLKTKCVSETSDDRCLQDVYMTVARFGLMRKRKIIAPKHRAVL